MKNEMLGFATATAIALLAGGAWAGPGGCGGPIDGYDRPMGRAATMKFDPSVRLERHLDFLKYQLRITPEQEPLWQAYAEKMKAEAAKGWQARSELTFDGLAAPERMSRIEKLMEERLAAMKDTHTSFARLYEALSPEQRAQADRYVGLGMGRWRTKAAPSQPRG